MSGWHKMYFGLINKGYSKREAKKRADKYFKNKR